MAMPWRQEFRQGIGPVFRGWKLRVEATLVLLVGGLVWVILYLGFLANHLSWYQNLSVVLATLLLIPLVVVLLWFSWGMAVRRRMWEWINASAPLPP